MVAIAWADSTSWRSIAEWWVAGKEAAEIAASHGWTMVPDELVDERPGCVDTKAREVLEQYRNEISKGSPPDRLPSDGLSSPSDLATFIDASRDPP